MECCQYESLGRFRAVDQLTSSPKVDSPRDIFFACMAVILACQLLACMNWYCTQVSCVSPTCAPDACALPYVPPYQRLNHSRLWTVCMSCGTSRRFASAVNERVTCWMGLWQVITLPLFMYTGHPCTGCQMRDPIGNVEVSEKRPSRLHKLLAKYLIDPSPCICHLNFAGNLGSMERYPKYP